MDYMYNQQFLNPYMYSMPMISQRPQPMQQDIYTYPYNLQNALKLITQAVAGEREDEMFYDYLIRVAPSEEDKNIIRGIRDDERKHYRLFREIYRELTGKNVPQAPEEQFEIPKSYCAGVKKALQGELNAVVRYRQILFAMQDRRHINMLTEIITDELRHGNLYNLIFSKNECSKEESLRERR